MPLSVNALAVRGRWIKHTYPGSAPLPDREPPPDNRWQRGDVVDALYLADSEATAWAEWYRHLAERMIPPLAQMPRELWRWQVDVEVADLSTRESLAAVGLSTPAPGRRNWPAYQSIGEQLSKDGWAGLLAPSAARPDGRIACIFASHWPPEHCTPIRATEITEPPPPPQGMTT